MPGIRNWQQHGVTLKVELATSGTLTVGGNQTDFPFTTGGEYGAPAGWDAGEFSSGNAGNESAYNWTTSTGIFTVNPKVSNNRHAGIWQIGVFPMLEGYRYQVGIQARVQNGRSAQSTRSVTLERSSNGGSSYSYYTGSQSETAQPAWEQILATGSAVPAGSSIGRINILGGPPTGGSASWGVQFQNLFVRQLDKATEPIVWKDITCDVQSIGLRYGRERFTNRYDVSTMQMDLVNNEGLYSFHNPHPFGLQPGRQVKITATYKGVTYPVAFHILDSMADAYDMDGRVLARWQLVDPTSILSNTEVATNQGIYPDGAAQRIGLLLDQVGYLPRLLDANVWDMQPIVASGRSIRDEAGVSADSEGGNFFGDRQGNCVYKNRNWLTTDTNLQQVTADLVGYPHGDDSLPIVDEVPTQSNAPAICINELNTDWSLARVINEVSLANAGGTAQVFRDEPSMKQYGPKTYSRHDFVLWTDNYLATRAADIMTGYSEPVLRVNTVSFAPGLSASWEFTLGVFLNWLVRVWYSHPTNYWGYAFCVHIQSIEHRITPTDWVTTMSVDLPESFVELEWAEFGWDLGTWDENLWDQGNAPAGFLWSTGQNWSDPNTKWGP